MHATLGLQSFQGTYDASAPARVDLDGTNGPLILRDAATPIGDTFVIEDSGGVDYFNVDPDQMNFGTATNRMLEFNTDPTGRGGIRYIPDGRTVTTAPTQVYFLQWDSTITTNIPGGAPFGNDTAPAMVGATGTIIFEDAGNLFSSSLLFNQGTQVDCRANIGPIYTMVNQPRISAGGGTAHTCSQHNALRIQTNWGGSNVGAGASITQTSCEYIFLTAFVDATVGSASVTTMNYLAAKSPTLTAGGTIGTFTVLDIESITGPTTIRGINSAMSSGTFIRHVGTAPSTFSGEIQMGNSTPIRFGSSGSSSVNLLRSGAGLLQMIGTGGSFNEGLTWNFNAASNQVRVTTTTSAALTINLPSLSVGTTNADGSENWQFGLTPGAKTITLAGDFSRAIFTSSANVTINAALTNFATWIINSPGGTIGSGSATNAANMLIQTSPGVGTNRYGLLVTSNPSGGTINRCARFQGAAGVLVDGELELDGALNHDGATIGFFGAVPAVQAAAYTPTNVTTDRSYDANLTTVDELADVLGTLIADLQTYGLIQ